MASFKQKKAVDIAVENGGNISSAMRQAGYSPITAKNPKKLTQSLAWQELMKKHFPDSKLAALHKKLLEKKEVIVVSDGSQNGSHLEWTGQPHSDSLKALETAYKIKGKMKEGETPTPVAPSTVVIINYGNRDNNPAVQVRATPIPDTSS